MNAYMVPSFLIWGFIIFIFALLLLLLKIIISFFKLKNSDKIILIDKNNRWSMISTKLKKLKNYTHKNTQYHLDADAGLLSHKGKALYHFSENKPTPLRIKYSKIDWLDSTSLHAMINNNLVQKILKPQDKFMDILFVLGAIGGMLAGLSSVLVLLIVSGVINVGTV